jgi:hypothetical protein
MANHRNRSHPESRYPQSELKGTVTVVADIVGPILPEHHWAGLADVQPSPGGAGDAECAKRTSPEGGSR